MIMPVMDGLMTIRALKNFNAQVKIIATSGLESHSKMLADNSLNIDKFLLKPYTTEILLNTLYEVLNDNRVKY
jgi:two-component system, cell cycle sensor histidine kinase and response regulator CckA